jgi:protein TonB
LAGDGPIRTGNEIWLRRGAIALGVAVAAALLTWLTLSLGHQAKAPKRQVAQIMLLPDRPPPPPPPEEHKIEPKEQPKQQEQAPRPDVQPAPEQLKMEGAAGDGPSPFGAGEVKNDYIGGDIGAGARYAAYVTRLEQFIQVELTRHNLRANNIKLFLWLLPDGAIQRFELAGGDGDADKAMRLALADLHRVDEPPADGMPMPVGLRISVR